VSAELRSRAALAGIAAFVCAVALTLAATGGGESGASAPVGSLAVPVERSAPGAGDAVLARAEALPRLGPVEALPELAAREAEEAPGTIVPAPARSTSPPPPRPPAPEPQLPAVPASPPPAPAPSPEPVTPPPASPEPLPDSAPAQPRPAPEPPPVDFDDSG
jgi:hypothetical protein